MLYSSLGMIILKFIQDSDQTADNDRYSFRLKASIKCASKVSSIQYVVNAEPKGPAKGY
jgi:hypothetical protein